jgi:hypothetical protein
MKDLIIHKCVFCNTVPVIESIFSSDSSARSAESRTLRCNCKKKRTNNGTFETARWEYSVAVINNDREAADIELVTEWNNRMPEITK